MELFRNEMLHGHPKDVHFANEKDFLVSRRIDVELRRACDVSKTSSRPIEAFLFGNLTSFGQLYDD